MAGAKKTHKFTGKTEDDVKSKFTEWHQKNAARMHVKPGQIKPIPAPIHPPEHQLAMEPVDRFSMSIEYEIKSPKRNRLRRR